MGVENANVVLIVFVLPGCPACHEYQPRLERQIDGFRMLGHPFVFYEAGMNTKRGEIPVLIVNAASQDPSVVSLADQHQVKALPTTVLLPKHGLPGRWEGAMSDTDIYNLLNAAVATNR